MKISHTKTASSIAIDCSYTWAVSPLCTIPFHIIWLFLVGFFSYLYKAYSFKLTLALKIKAHYGLENKFLKLSLLKILLSLTADLTALKLSFCHKSGSVDFWNRARHETGEPWMEQCFTSMRNAFSLPLSPSLPPHPCCHAQRYTHVHAHTR